MAEAGEHSSQILAFVLDSLQVVSYKWLSRKFCISSNESKRILEKVVEQHGSSIDVIYAVSGWSKLDRHCYSVKLVPKSKLQEAKDLLDGHVSIHVYSIQPCIPKDSAELWSAEYIQSEELFKQPSDVNNCLRDNRFSAVSCNAVARKVKGMVCNSTSMPAAPSSSSMEAAPKRATPLDSFKEVAPKVAAPPSSSVKPEVPAAQPSTRQNASGNSAVDAATVLKGHGTVPGNKGGAASTTKKKGAAGDGALANLWGRASTKSKPVLPDAPVAAAMDDLNADSDDDATNFARIRRGEVRSNSKRMRCMVVDDDDSSDDDKEEELEAESVISLSSPEVPSKRLESSTLRNEDIPKLKDVRLESADVATILEEKAEKIEEGKGKDTVVGNGAAAVAPEPKKRKVLRTRIDERGREVTEVVRESEYLTAEDNKEANPAKSNANAPAAACAKVGLSKVLASTRPLGSANVKASDAVVQNPSNKAAGGGGSKPSGKGAPKGAQQGRISSFFRKKN